MTELANYLVHIYGCERVCAPAGVLQDAMFMTLGELSDAILMAH